jgi:hypothetical protein
MNIYILIVKLYYRQQVTPEELAEYFKVELKEYVHQNHENAVRYTCPADAVKAILECEKRSIEMAKNF